MRTMLFFVLIILVLSSPSAPAESVEASLGLMQLLQLTAGATVQEQIERVPPWLDSVFHIRPTCSFSLFIGISEDECLLGLRSLASGLIETSMPPPLETIVLHISKPGDWRPIDVNAPVASVSVPYNASETDTIRFIAVEMTKPSYQQRIGILNQIADLKGDLEDKTGIEIEIDDAIDNLTAISGLYNLTLLLRENAKAFSGHEQVVKISDRFQFPYEENLKLKESIRATADLTQLASYFADPLRQSRPIDKDPNWPRSFLVERSELNEERSVLMDSKHFAKVDCSSLGSLRQISCLHVLKKIGNILQMPTVHMPAVDVLVVTGSSEMAMPADFYVDRGKTILLIRDDTQVSAMVNFFYNQGWASQQMDPLL